jgi:hypothetical protein
MNETPHRTAQDEKGIVSYLERKFAFSAFATTDQAQHCKHDVSKKCARAEGAALSAPENPP